MQIGGLRKLSLNDYPKVLSCVVSLVGCNLRCPFCDSVEFVLPGAIQGQKSVSEKSFFQFLKQAKGSVDGVVLTGGEPCIHQELPAFCQKIKNLGFKIKLDTNGTHSSMLKNLLDQRLVDYVALDIKAPREKYGQAIGAGDISLNYILNQIEESVVFLKTRGIDHEFCTTLTPLLDKKDILSIIQWVRPENKFRLQAFRAEQPLEGGLSQLPQHPREMLFQIQQALAPFCPNFEVKLN